jgi:hypothetical protein
MIFSAGMRALIYYEWRRIALLGGPEDSGGEGKT